MYKRNLIKENKKVVIFFIIFFLLVSFVSTKIVTDLAEARPKRSLDLIYKDWEFSDEYSYITIDGVTYNNYTVMYRNKDTLHFVNMASAYLNSPVLQNQYSASEYFNDIIENDVSSFIMSFADFYPYSEPLLINNQLWHETKFAQYYKNYFERVYGGGTGRAGRDAVFETAFEPAYAGYADKILVDGYSLTEARTKYPLSEREVATNRVDIFKSYNEMSDHEGTEQIKVNLDSSYRFREHVDTIRAQTKDAFKNMDRLSVAKSQALEATKQENLRTNAQLVIPANSEELSRVTKRRIMGQDTSSNNQLTDGEITLIQATKLSEGLGLDVKWDPEFNTVIIQRGNDQIIFTINADYAIVNKRQVKIETPAVIKDGKAMVPLRFVSDILGLKVEWQSSTNNIIVKD